MTFEYAALQVLSERDEVGVYVGSFGLWEDIYERKYGVGGNGTRTRNPHPMNRYEAVISALRRSNKFYQAGYIRSVGFSAKEILHPYFKPTPTTPDERNE